MRAFFIAGLRSAFFLLGPSLLAAQIQGGLYTVQQPDQTATAPDTARVTVLGVVRNAATGGPLPRTLVRIEGDADTGTLTNGEGRFEIPGVPAGPQIIHLLKPGFRDRPYATEEPGLQADGPAHSVLLAAQMPELDFTLEPNCAIHGHIELSTGDPADGITITLLKQVVRFGRAVWAQEATAKTNGDGKYRFGGLPDGVYALYTLPALESEPAVSVVAPGSGANVARGGYPSVFYPDAREFAGAARIRLSAGQQAEANFSLALEPFYPVTALGLVQAGGSAAGKTSPPGGYTATVMDASGHQLPYTAQYDETTHSLQASLPDGTYVLVVRCFLHPQLLGDSVPSSKKDSRRAGLLAGSVEFTVAGHAVAGLRVPLAAPIVNTVQLRMLHGTASQTGINTASVNDASGIVNLSMDQADGIPQPGGDSIWTMDNGQDTIEFTAHPGAYWLSAFLSRRSLCAGPFTAGGLNLARDPLTLSLSISTPPMELTLRDDCATLALALPPALAAFLPGEEPFYTVYVVPDFDTVEDVPPMTVHPSSGPTLTIDGLTPGSYHVYTFDAPLHLEYRNPAVLAALPNPGQQVTLSPGAKTNLVLEVPGS
ncbi:MAG TPA: hypothetical protein VGE83_10105 [Terracidiphilus sp.]|jgi:hypothetical protein